MITLIFSVISSQTAFDVDFCFRMVMATYHHAATFEGLADEFNDLHCKGILFKTQSALLFIKYCTNMSINIRVSQKNTFFSDRFRGLTTGAGRFPEPTKKVSKL